MLEVQRSKNDIKVLQNFGIMLVLFPRASLQHLNPATDHPLPEFSTLAKWLLEFLGIYS